MKPSKRNEMMSLLSSEPSERIMVLRISLEIWHEFFGSLLVIINSKSPDCSEGMRMIACSTTESVFHVLKEKESVYLHTKVTSHCHWIRTDRTLILFPPTGLLENGIYILCHFLHPRWDRYQPLQQRMSPCSEIGIYVKSPDTRIPGNISCDARKAPGNI
jgi:hypothetical protein